MLLETTSKYRVETESEAQKLIAKFREDAEQKGYLIKKSGYERKDKKAKGEIVATVFVVTITQVFGSIWEDL